MGNLSDALKREIDFESKIWKDFVYKLTIQQDRVKKFKEYLEDKNKEDVIKIINKEKKRIDIKLNNNPDLYFAEPTNILNLLFDVAKEFGNNYNEYLDDFDNEFGAGRIKYKDLIFNWINGQGTVLRIFNGKEILITII